MKIFRFLGMAVVAVCMCANFTACSKDGNGSDSGTSSGEKRLVKMVLGDGEYVETYSFTYDDQGRVIEMRVGDGNDAWNILYKYEGNTISTINDGQTEYIYTIENGLIRSTFDPNAPSNQSTESYTYNIAGRLVYISAYTDTDIKWDGDKLISIVGPYDFHDTYTYGNITCKKGYHPLLGVTRFWATNPEFVGMKTNQLPASCAKKFNGSYREYDYTETYQYEFDSEGYISKIIVTDDRGYTSFYTLTWK